MRGGEAVRLSLGEARGLMLVAQGLLDPPPAEPGPDEVRSTVERLGAVQIDAISVVARTQYLVLWSRLGAYDPGLLDALLYPERAVFEYWAHAASIVPIRDYRYYRPRMLDARAHPWTWARDWMAAHPEVIERVLSEIRARGPLASADFERPPDDRRAQPWDWYGPKETRPALEILWTAGDLMIHSRRAGQKRYDLFERVLAEAFGEVPPDDDLPTIEERLRFFVGRTIRALGVVTPAWLSGPPRLDCYFMLPRIDDSPAATRAAVASILDAMARAGEIVPAAVEGLPGSVWIDRVRLGDLDRLRGGDRPGRTTLLSPFDSLIWDRARARQLFGYEVCFEAYVVPEKRRFGYYCLAILHRGRLVGRLDPKLERDAGRLVVRAVYLEPGVAADQTLLDGLAGALGDLARFLGARTVAVERSEPVELAPTLAERLTEV
jgi:uncharacterized protein YcaQ